MVALISATRPIGQIQSTPRPRHSFPLLSLTHSRSQRRTSHKSFFHARLTSNQTGRVPRWPSRAQVRLITEDRAKFSVVNKTKVRTPLCTLLTRKLTCHASRLTFKVSGREHTRWRFRLGGGGGSSFRTCVSVIGSKSG